MQTTEKTQTSYQIKSSSLEETLALGQLLGQTAEDGDRLFLTGDLGAGKTSLTQGIALGLGIREPVTSPTFTLRKDYVGRLDLVHMDAYRLSGSEEGRQAGLEEALEDGGLVVLEWALVLEELWPEDYLFLSLTRPEAGHAGLEGGRQLTFTASGPFSRAWLARIKSAQDGQSSQSDQSAQTDGPSLKEEG